MSRCLSTKFYFSLEFSTEHFHFQKADERCYKLEGRISAILNKTLWKYIYSFYHFTPQPSKTSSYFNDFHTLLI